MKKELSAYLDLLRILAASAVFIEHLSYGKISGGFLWQLGNYGHSAVIVFFVLSGFVIAFSADQKEKTLLDFCVARFARLYSVVLPAIVLTIVCDYFGLHHNPNVYYDHDTSPAIPTIGLSLLFLTQSWQKIPLFSNGSFWSLPYEFWYYQIFAAALFLRGGLRISAVIIAFLIAGPAILLLFPIWLLGALSYHASKTIRLRRPGIVWAVTGSVVIVAILINNPAYPTSPLLPTAFSMIDYLIGIALGANVVAAAQLDFGLTKIKRTIAYVAGMTFALYLFHMPLLLLAAAYMPHTNSIVLCGTTVSIFALTVVYLLSYVTERQKHRWRFAFYRLFTWPSAWPYSSPENGKASTEEDKAYIKTYHNELDSRR